MTFPKDSHFANIKLKPGFNRRVLKKLDSVDDEYDKLEKKKNKLKKKVNEIGRHLKIRVPHHRKIQILFDQYKDKLLVVNPKSKKRVAKEKIMLRRGKTCEACRRSFKHIQHAHIIKKNKFRGPNAKYNEYRSHRANILLLCDEDHKDLDHQLMKKQKLGRLVKNMKKRNKQILKDLDKDSQLTRDFKKRLKKMEEDLKKEVNDALKHLFNQIHL